MEKYEPKHLQSAVTAKAEKEEPAASKAETIAAKTEKAQTASGAKTSEKMKRGEAQNGKKKKKLHFSVWILIGIVGLALLGFIVVYMIVNHYTSLMDKTPDDLQGLTYEEVWAQKPDSTGEGSAEIPAVPDEETERAIAAADEALSRLDNLEESGAEGSKDKTGIVIKQENDIVNYLIIGSDRRDAIYGNSDVMMVVSVNRTTQKIHITSLMRAMYVRIPASSGAFNGMLNWAYSMQGAPLCVKTIELNFGLDIDHYVVFDFNSFKSVVNALGGVDVELTPAEAGKVSMSTNTAVRSGLTHLNGEQALAYARERHLDNDFKRTGRQRAVLQACIKSLKGCSLSQLNEVAETIMPYLKTDMTNMDIIAELPNAVKYLNYDVDQLMLPVENMEGKSYIGNTHIGGHEMYIVDWDNNLTRLEEFINN